MDLEQIKTIIAENIPAGISSEISMSGTDVIISDNMHMAGRIDMLNANNELNDITDILSIYGYEWEILKSPSDDDAGYRLKITSKNEVAASEILARLQQKKLSEQIDAIVEVNKDVSKKLIKLIGEAIAAGFDINTKIKDYKRGYSQTLLERFAHYDSVVSYLISQGADIKKYGGKVAVGLLSIGNNYIYTFPIAVMLIEAGADINYNGGSATMLYEAVSKCENKDRHSDDCGIKGYYEKCYEAFEYLLKKGADPNIPIYNGETCLMKAAENGNEYLVRQLLKHGAKKSPVSNYGRKAVDYARDPAIKKLVEKGVFDRE